jgi:hypothetical protein
MAPDGIGVPRMGSSSLDRSDQDGRAAGGADHPPHRWMFPDSKPLLGPSKSWRGVVLSVVTPAAAAPLLGVTWTVGLLVGAAAMAGDLLSSFFKRRLGIPSGGMARGIDQVPEALLRLLAARDALGLSLGEAFVATVLFWASEITVSPILHRLGIRERPY